MIKTNSKSVRVEVNPSYLPSRSDLSKPIFFFSYTIKIENLSGETVQLQSRYWNITDGNGNVVRLYNPTDEVWEGRIETDLPLFNVRGCDLLENETTKPRISKSGWPAKLNGKAIATWRFN